MISINSPDNCHTRNSSDELSASSVTITGIILAGGRSKRMGGQDKGLVSLSGELMITHCIRAIKSQVNYLIINANRNIERYLELGYPVVSDSTNEFLGPLAGMLAALKYATSDYILTTPCDSPLLDANYSIRMLAALEKDQSKLCVASDGLRLQPVFVLLHTSLYDDLKQYVNDGGRKIDLWLSLHQTSVAEFADNKAMFKNINTPEDLKALENELK